MIASKRLVAKKAAANIAVVRVSKLACPRPDIRPPKPPEPPPPKPPSAPCSDRCSRMTATSDNDQKMDNDQNLLH